MNSIHFAIALTCAATVLVGGCANTNSRPDSSYSNSSYSNSSSYGSPYGVVNAIDVVRGSENNDIGAGAVIGGIVGGVLGHQVGKGRGKDAATVVGAVGGAVAGHEIEKNNRSQDAYRISVRMDNGSYQTVTQDSVNDLRIGDRVRVENDRVYRY